jgi:hypothetical protein
LDEINHNISDRAHPKAALTPASELPHQANKADTSPKRLLRQVLLPKNLNQL